MPKTIDQIPKKSKMYQNIEEYAYEIAGETVLVIDPSIGSSSSAPGWALYEEGTLVESGTLNTGGSHLPLWQRARNLGQKIEHLCILYRPEVLVYEDIPATSGYNSNSQASLLKAVGIVLACSTSDIVIGVHPASWKNYVSDSYTKGDEQDAIEIGKIVTELAELITTRSFDTGRKVSRRANKAR